MKILQVVPYFPLAYAFGGPVKVAYQISRELTKRGHEVVVYTTDVKDLNARLDTNSGKAIDELKDDGISVCFFRNLAMISVKKFKLFITPEIILHAKEEVKKFDVIHLHEYRTFQNIVTAHYARKYDIPYLLQTHGSIPRIGSWRKLKWIYDVFFGNTLLKDASRIIALSRVKAEQYKAMGVPKKIAIIPNEIDFSEYVNLPSKGAFKRRFGIPEEKKIVLYLGRIHEIKGIDFLIKTYAHLVNEMKFKNVTLVIAEPDDGYLSRAKALVYTLRVSDLTMFVKPLYGRDKLATYVDSDLCVLPSSYETFPMALLEVYACGKPIVASNVGGLKKLVIDDEKILYLLNLNDSNRALEIGRKARMLVEEKYSIDKVVDNLEELYMEVAHKKPL